jgi:excisionase family DNA binding protein
LQVARKGQSGQVCRVLTVKRGAVMELEQVYKIGQVAKALKVTDKTVYRMLCDGRLQGVKVGNRWRIRAVDLEGFLKQHTVRRHAVKRKVV